MKCPHCHSKKTVQRPQKTQLDYHEYRCRACGRQFNERTGTAYNFLTHRSEVVILVVRYYYEFKTSLDDVVKLMAMRGIELSHQTVHNWTQSVSIEMALKFRARRQGKAGKKWHADATYIRVEGRWCYLYRAIDKEGNLLDVYLSDTRIRAMMRPLKRFLSNVLIPRAFNPNKSPPIKKPHWPTALNRYSTVMSSIARVNT